MEQLSEFRMNAQLELSALARQLSCVQCEVRLHGIKQELGWMPELLKRQIDRLETAIDLSTDWLEVQYLMVELDQLKALYDESQSEAA